MRARRIIIGLSAVALAGGAFAIATGVSNAGESCAGLDQALQNNLNFIAGQKAAPDALSDARIANRQAVVDLINQRRATAGCTGNVQAQPPANAARPPANAGNGNAGRGNGGNAGNGGNGNAQNGNAGNPGGAATQVCNGSTVTLSGEGGAPAASSGTFPIGTTLRVTNLDNNHVTTVKVASVSGSCTLLNNAAFEQVREPGKFLIRRALIQKIG